MGTASPFARVAWAWMRVAVALALVTALAWRAGLADVGALAREMRWGWVALGAAIVPVSIGVRAWNHALLANMRVRLLTAWEAYRLTLVGVGINLFVPTGASDLLKAHYGYRTLGHAEDMIVSSALDKLTSVTAVGAMGVVGAIATAEWAFAALAAAVTLLSLLPFVWPRIVPWRFVLRVLAPRAEVDDAVIHAVSRPPIVRLAVVYAVSVLGWVLTYAVIHAMCKAVGAEVDFVYLLALAPLSTLARMIPVSAGGIGLGEFTLAVLLQRVGVAADVAAQAALLGMVLLVLAPGAVGLLLLARGRHQRTSPTSQGNDDTTSASPS